MIEGICLRKRGCKLVFGTQVACLGIIERIEGLDKHVETGIKSDVAELGVAAQNALNAFALAYDSGVDSSPEIHIVGELKFALTLE